MCNTYRKDPKDPRNIFVANIVLCKATPFYGFHAGERPFLKISMLNPLHLSKFADLLRNGAILNTNIQPYESHIPYILQFFADFNLYGCGWIKLSDAYFREPIAESFWRPDDLKILKPRNGFERVSYCALEIDATPNLIINRGELKIPQHSSSFNLTSLQELWSKESERRHSEGHASANFTPKMAEPQFATNSQWNYITEMQQQVEKLVSQSKAHPDFSTDSSLLNISRKNFNLSDSMPTAFSSVDSSYTVSKRLRSSQRVPGIGTHINNDVFETGEKRDDIVVGADNYNDDDDDENNELDLAGDITPEGPSSTSSCPRKRMSDDEPISSLSKAQKTTLSPSFHITSQPAGKTFSYFSESFESSFTLSQQRLLNSYLEDKANEGRPPKWVQGMINFFHLAESVLVLRAEPMTVRVLLSSLEDYGIPQTEYPEPFFSSTKDVPAIPMTFAGVEYRLKGSDPQYLDQFEFTANVPPFDAFIDQSLSNSSAKLEFLDTPPPRSEVINWLQENGGGNVHNHKYASQITGATQQGGAENYTDESVHYRLGSGDPKNMSVISVEIHASGDDGNLPDPEKNPVDAIFWKFLDDEQMDDTNSGVIFCGHSHNTANLRKYKNSTHETTEFEMIQKLVYVIRILDPDILTSYEVQKSSWGYLIERCNAAFGYNMIEALSRVRSNSNRTQGTKWGLQKTTDISITGRHVLNLWRILRYEVNLLQYSLENVVYHVFNERIPRYTNQDLSKWFGQETDTDLGSFVQYYTKRVNYNLRLIVSQELVSRYSEQARLIGIDYYSVFYRGSQFKVESLLTRLAKQGNYLMISPSKKQVGQQNALEYIPLVMEPETKFYKSPVLVLDFQSLYPSIVIAYNYCYSTCLGRIVPWMDRNKLGVVDLERDPELLGVLKDDIVIAPNGIMYTKPQVRKSTLSKMLTELLDTRMIVKDGMRDHPNNAAFQKSMNSRQLALKLTANVTYGYTSATYSGRMPCAEIADSIVLSAREILEATVETIQNTEKWGARVVYGDTDSIFVHLPGKSREQAFQIGEEIENVITEKNKPPIKLKFEKLYHPCVLLAKKRYVGYMYEDKSQKEPVFDAKGTETVRRDGTPAEQKIEEKALRLLFESYDLSKVRGYLEGQWKKILRGSVSIQDFLFSKEVKLGNYKKGYEPAGALVSLKNMEKDKRAEPQYKERVPYVVISGPPGSRLIDRCVDPEYLLSHPWAQLDAEYYITKNLIPPLERIFNLMGADVKSWYLEMPKELKLPPVDYFGMNSGAMASTTLRTYMKSSSCVVCGSNKTPERGAGTCCISCLQDSSHATFVLQSKIKKKQKSVMDLEKICRHCAEIPPAREIKCISGDCPIYYSRIKCDNQLKGYLSVLDETLTALSEW